MFKEEAVPAFSTEARHEQSTDFDALTAEQMMRVMHAGDREALQAVERILPQLAAAVEAVAARLARGGRLFYVGAGTSGRLGVLDAAECPPTFHTPATMVQGVIAGGDRALRFAVEGAEDDAAAGETTMQEHCIEPRDVVIGIAASGRTPYVLGAMAAAMARGALTIGMSCVSDSPVEQAGDQALTAETGAEVLTGSTRLKAGTATKLMLNMLSTGVMARLGYVHGNLMVNVQPTNAKLRDRACRIVMELTGSTRQRAQALLEAADGDLKSAVVMEREGVDAEEARRRLREAGGILRRVLSS